MFFFYKSRNFFVTDIPSAGTSLGAKAADKQPQAAGVSDADADLEARLENLRRQWAGGGANQWLTDEWVQCVCVCEW